MHSLIIFASGKGSNAQAIIDYFRDHPSVNVSLIVSNKSDAGVLAIAEKEGVRSQIITKTDINSDEFVEHLRSHAPSLIILAGFLWKIPSAMVDAFDNRIINIHPSLLPAHGGKGMYGHHVHSSVLNTREQESGITIHYVDEVYDSGSKILQAHCPVKENDTPDTLAERIHKLEHFFYPRTIEYLLKHM